MKAALRRLRASDRKGSSVHGPVKSTVRTSVIFTEVSVSSCGTLFNSSGERHLSQAAYRAVSLMIRNLSMAPYLSSVLPGYDTIASSPSALSFSTSLMPWIAECVGFGSFRPTIGGGFLLG